MTPYYSDDWVTLSASPPNTPASRTPVVAEPLVVMPIPTNMTEVLAWFTALDTADFRNLFLGAATVAIVGLLIVLGTMALLRLTRD